MAKRKSRKIKVGILGTGNIGSDLLVKIQRSNLLECSIFSGQNPNSNGIKRAKSMGVKTSFKSIKAIEENHCDIVFDATSVKAHFYHAPILKKLGKFTIDMTPSRIGKMCIPIINLEKALKEKNVNMITCGGQAAVPIASAIMKVHPETKYIEVVSSISSKSAGLATRDNIDEYTQTTGDAIHLLAKVPKAKAIIILNPAEPPILMRNTIYAITKKPKMDLLTKEVKRVVKEIQKYVPGYKLILEPVFEKSENSRVTIMIRVTGLGDYLPLYAGNLDIINCAAIAVAEEYARKNINC